MTLRTISPKAARLTRAALHAIRPVFFAVVVLGLAAAPAVVASGWLVASGWVRRLLLVLPDDGHEHAAYVAISAVVWGALALALVALRRRRPLDLLMGAAALATLGAWILAIYEWNIAKWGHIELGAVGPTTTMWPFLIVFVVTLIPLIPIRRGFAFATLTVVSLALLIDVILAAGGSLRDGSISGSGVFLGLLYCLELAVLTTWVVLRARR